MAKVVGNTFILSCVHIIGFKLYVSIEKLNILVKLLKWLCLLRIVYSTVQLLYTHFIPRPIPNMRNIEIVVVLNGIESFLEFFGSIETSKVLLSWILIFRLD
jgi:hypothetical protein